MKVVAILQARMGSTRLPGKMLLPLLGKPLVQHVMERVQRATLLDDVVLAVPMKDVASFAPIANDAGCRLYSYAGDESDLVGRYLAAAEVQRADVIVRIPCDNPCVDPEYIDRAVSHYLISPQVFYTNTTELAGLSWVDGIGAEIFSISRLKWLHQFLKHPKVIPEKAAEYREHPHRLFFEQWETSLPPSHLRLDVNTQADYDFIRTIFDHFGHNHFTAAQIVEFLQSKEVSHAPQERVQSQNH